MKSFEYPSTLVKKVQRLSHKVAEKNEVLDFIKASSSKADPALEEVNHSLVHARKRIKDLENSLEESLESHKKVDDGVSAMRQENLDLSKELAKSPPKVFFITNDALKQVECFYRAWVISQDRVCLNQAITNGKMVSFKDE